MLIWVSYLSSYFCFCHEVFSKRKFWIGLWSGVWIALQKYCWSDPRIALQKLYWIGVWIAFQKFWSVQCTGVEHELVRFPLHLRTTAIAFQVYTFSDGVTALSLSLSLSLFPSLRCSAARAIVCSRDFHPINI